MKDDRLFTKDFSLVLLTTFFVFVNHFMLVSTFPFYIEKLGGTEAVAGAAAVLFCVIGVICRPFVGWLLDSGKRKRILFFGIVGIILMSLGYWLVSVLVLTFLLRMIHGASLIFAATSGSTITTDIVPRNKLARGMGMFGMSVALATAVSPSLGLFLMSRGGFGLLFPISALIMGAGLILFFFLKAPEIELKKKPLIVRDLFEQNALPSSLTIVMFMMTFGAVENFMAKYGAEAGLPGGLYFLTMAAVVILTRIVLGKFTDRKGEPFFRIRLQRRHASLLSAPRLRSVAASIFSVRRSYRIRFRRDRTCIDDNGRPACPSRKTGGRQFDISLLLRYRHRRGRRNRRIPDYPAWLSVNVCYSDCRQCYFLCRLFFLGPEAAVRFQESGNCRKKHGIVSAELNGAGSFFLHDV